MGRLLSPHNGFALVLTCAWTLVLAGTGHYEVLLYLAPALLIAVPLLAGRYVGESLVLRIASSRRRRRPRPARAHALPRPLLTLAPRGSGLIARSLAGRAPPRIAISQI
jgi:hypothetical protein